MREQSAVTVKKIAEQIGLSISGVRYHVNKMKKDGIVEHIGSSKKGTWVIHNCLYNVSKNLELVLRSYFSEKQAMHRKK